MTSKMKRDIVSFAIKNMNVSVAQLDRVLDYESRGRGFEPLQAHQNRDIVVSWFFIFSVFYCFWP